MFPLLSLQKVWPFEIIELEKHKGSNEFLENSDFKKGSWSKINHLLLCMISHSDVKPERNSQPATPKFRKLHYTSEDVSLFTLLKCQTFALVFWKIQNVIQIWSMVNNVKEL